MLNKHSALFVDETLMAPNSPEDTAERTDLDVEDIQASSQATALLIEDFLKITFIPEFKKHGRTVLFTHYLIREVAQRWGALAGVPAREGDLSRMTRLIATALTDFDYALSQSQHSSDTWLSDRIRKQIFRKKHRRSKDPNSKF
jgi:hypothetical protein